MRGQDSPVRRAGSIGAIVGALLFGLSAGAATAEGLFTFTDDASLAGSMAELDEALAHDAAPADPCRLDILSDMRGNRLFDDRTSGSMHRELAAAILGADRIEGCTVLSHAVGQDEVAAFIDQRRQAGDLGQTLALSYYRLSEGVTVFAILRDADGNIIGSTGRFDLPVALAADDAAIESAASGETETPAAEDDTSVTATATSKAGTASTPDVAVPERRPLTNGAAARAEATVRQRLAAETRTTRAQERAFNLRRIEAGVPSSIRTIQVVDARGRDAGLVADLADRFLGELATSPESSVETTGGDGGDTLVAIGNQPNADIEAIDIRAAEAGAAFRRILDNESDIVVTRAPISPADAERFAETYGVNMRSRYAEHVVAIARREAESIACGIHYPEEDGMLMSTEDHPASERVYFYVNPSIPNAARDRFVAFALSDEGQKAVADHAVDLRLRMSDAGYAAWRYRTTGEQEPELDELQDRFRGLIRTSQRVSSTFRFDFASADLVLDSRSEQDLENLIDLVRAEAIDGRRIQLFGFADALGPASFNAELSRDRADAVATRLRLAGIPVPPRNVHGIGEDSPVACNLLPDGERDELGARKNRRVEVWIES